MFVGAATAKLEHVADVVSAEAAALVEGLKLASRVGANSILVQSDSVIIAEVLQQNFGHSMVAAPIQKTCRSLLRDYGKVLLEHCNRESNTGPHALAQNGRDDSPTLWLDSPPDFISSLLANDVTLFKLIKLVMEAFS